MAPKYRVTYFPIKALGEPIRLLLSYGKIDFEDRRISSEEWPKYKESMPMGQMPTLEIDDKVYYQSGPISRYLAKQFGLAGDNDLESLEVDIAVECINDFRIKGSAVHFEPDEEAKEKKFLVLQEETIPFLLKKLEERATINKGYLAIGKLSWADFYFVALVDYLCVIARQDILAANPNLASVKANVLALPEIQAWYEKSPKCDF